MKRFMFVLAAVLLVAFAATPAFAADGNGDQVCFGGSATVRAEETTNSVGLFGCDVRIEKGAKVLRDVVAFGGDIVIEEGALVGKSVASFGGDVRIAGRVESDVALFGGDVTLESTAYAGHDIIVFGGRVDKKEGATVVGQVVRNSGTYFPRVNVPAPPRPPVFPGSNGADWGYRFVSDVFSGLVTAIGLAALGVLIIVFLPKQLKQVSDVAQASALPSVGVGCLTWLVVPPLMILFIVTCLGIPLSVILGIALVAALAFGWITLSIILGERLLNALKVKNTAPILAMVAGLLVLWLVTVVPVLGWFIGLFASALGLGAVVLTRFGTRPYPTLATVPATVPALAPSAPVAPTTPASAASDDATPSI